MRIKRAAVFIALVMVLLAAWPPVLVQAADRKAAITGPGSATVGQTFTITLGFDSKINTRSCDFSISYDNSLIKLDGISNVSGLTGTTRPKSDEVGSFSSPLRAMLVYMDDGAPADKILALRFKVLKAGSVTIRLTDASDGVDGNTISMGSVLNVSLVQAATPTTTPNTTKTTTPTTITRTTTKTTTTTTKTTQSGTTTTSSVSSESSAESTPVESQPELMTSGIMGKRYDGAELSIPETQPGESQIPESFSDVEIPWKEERVAGYQSETLPYTLYWLSDKRGATDFYLFDEETSSFVPYLRTQWSSRYFVFTVVPEDQIPDGFELATEKIWGSDVPVYKPLSDYYVSKDYYDEFLSGATTPEPEIPDRLYLLALRMNDSEEKGLYFYDATLDSLIRKDLWLVPVAGSILDIGSESEPPVTEPSEPLPTESEPLETVGDLESSGRTVTLFGYSVPLAWLIGLGIFILLLLAAVLCLAVLLYRARRLGLLSEVSDSDEEEEALVDADGLADETLVFPVVGESDEADEALPAEDENADEPVDTESGWISLEETLKRIEEKREEASEAHGPDGGEDFLIDADGPADEALDFPVVGESDESDESFPAEDEDLDIPVDKESSWTSLEEALKRIEERRGESNDYPAGLNPISHRRPERDDPEDTEEL